MRLKSFTFILLCLFLISGIAKEKFGKVSKEVLQATSFAEAPNEDAIVLFDIGEMRIKDFKLIFDVHRRIKILTEKGKDNATIKIPYYYKDKILEIKALAILPNGKKIKVKKKTIIEEEHGKYYRDKVIIIPGVEVGSVIEYKYKMISEYFGDLEPWYFQSSLYTKLSRLTAYIPYNYGYLSFMSNVKGLEPDPITDRVKDFETGLWIGKYTWEFAELPGIKKEPYMNSMKDYLTRINFQISTYQDQYHYIEYIKDWNTLAKQMGERLNEYLRVTGDVKKACSNLLGENTLPNLDNAKKLYKFVRDELKTTTYNMNLKKLNDILKGKKASASAKNILLISMLRHIGIDANPVLISTTNNGIASQRLPKLDQFNMVIVKAKIGKFSYFMDTGKKYIPMGTLPSMDLVNFGFEIKNINGDFTEILSRQKANIVKRKINAKLDAGGNLNCKMEVLNLGYYGAIEKSKCENKDINEIWEKRLKDKYANVVFDSVVSKGFDEEGIKVITEVYYKITEFAQVAGDKIYLQMPLYSKTDGNVFKLEKRTFPVDFNFPFKLDEELNIELPDNTLIEDIPEDFTENIPNGNLNYKFKSNGKIITVSKKLKLSKKRFLPNEYKALREMYGTMAQKDQLQIVLQVK